MRSEAVKRAQEKYKKKLKKMGVKTNKTFILNCHLQNDKDIIEVLENKENKNGYIKKLIREDQKRG